MALSKPVSAEYLKLLGATSGNVQIYAPASFTSYTLTLPTDDGTANQVLTTDGSGVLSWTSATSGITTLNGLTATTQTFATGTSGTDFNISSAGSVHTFNIPSASITNRGLVTTGTQTLAGDKTLQGLTTVAPSAQTSGSPSLLTVTGPAHTTLTAAEQNDIYFNLARTVEFTGSATPGAANIANERAIRINSPTYQFTNTGAQVIAKASTMSIAGPPVIGGSNGSSITDAYSLEVASGNALFSGLIKAGTTPTTLTDSAGKILSGALNVVGITQGGTGSTTAQAAINAIAGLTTKGDLLVNNGTNDVRKGVGTDGQVLNADSTASEGIAWVTLALRNAVTTTGTLDSNGELSLSVSSADTKKVFAFFQQDTTYASSLVRFNETNTTNIKIKSSSASEDSGKSVAVIYY